MVLSDPLMNLDGGLEIDLFLGLDWEGRGGGGSVMVMLYYYAYKNASKKHVP